MSKHLWIAFTVMLTVMLTVQHSASELEIPSHPDEAMIVERIISVEGHAVERGDGRDVSSADGYGVGIRVSGGHDDGLLER